jgi:hypothetical protein
LKYTFAEQAKPFEIRYSTVRRDSGLLSGYARERDAMHMLESALKELAARGVMSSFDRKNITGARKKLQDWFSRSGHRSTSLRKSRLRTSASCWHNRKTL